MPNHKLPQGLSPTSIAFREMMLNGRVNELMNEGVQEGIAQTHAAREADALKGSEWWNGLDEAQRKEWMARTGNSGLAADAWAEYKRVNS